MKLHYAIILEHYVINIIRPLGVFSKRTVFLSYFCWIFCVQCVVFSIMFILYVFTLC